MPDPMRDVGARIATARRARRMTQVQLAAAAHISPSLLRKIEQGQRRPSDEALDGIAAALSLDPSRLEAGPDRSEDRVRIALPAVSAAIAAYDVPAGVLGRSLAELRAAVAEAAAWRLASQYVRLVTAAPTLLADTLAAFHTATGQDTAEAARLLTSAARSADAVAYKHGARDLSARLIELMRWAAPHAGDPLLPAVVSYVRTETFFAARAHDAGQRALEMAIDAAPPPDNPPAAAARGALHMRAAVIAARAKAADSARAHLREAGTLAERAPEAVYAGTAFGPDSVRIHRVAVAVSLGGDHAADALTVAREWKPPTDLPAERRSGFYIELARAQLWTGRTDHAFESLKVARRIAPQHTREHPWARETAATLRRLKRADAESVTAFAEWVGAV
ncbi:helix-turn-helix domain-containing protein [Streptomyces sp. NRRL S-118]|uniref:helix-turn-helix domain-containing protein n=1 Tax=Streptomyces sp. NRRL S-118 TaxID=1463881 RepID=UPI0004CB3397|nr:helix-turn-helix transcriptional regulator [Streptomyces sp. NRRL S-118]